MKKIFENAIWWSGVVMVGLVLGISLQFVRAWTEPTDAPPGGNLGAPLNTGDISQDKNSFLAVRGLVADVLKIPASIISGTPQAGSVLKAKETFPGSGVFDGQVAWAAGSGGGGCYVSYKDDATDAACATGFKNIGFAGTWGFCAGGGSDVGAILTFFLPASGSCPPGWSVSPTDPKDRMKAYICCQN